MKYIKNKFNYLIRPALILVILTMLGAILAFFLTDPILDLFYGVVLLTVPIALISIYIVNNFYILQNIAYCITYFFMYKLVMYTAAIMYILTINYSYQGVLDTIGKFIVGDVAKGNYYIASLFFVLFMILSFFIVNWLCRKVGYTTAVFILDDMPSMYAKVENDLHKKNITNNEAKARKEDILILANFFGAMDGSSKFVKTEIIFVCCIGIGSYAFTLLLNEKIDWILHSIIGATLILLISTIMVAILMVIITKKNIKQKIWT